MVICNICKDCKYYLEHIKQSISLFEVIIHSFTFLLAFLACVNFQESSKFKVLQGSRLSPFKTEDDNIKTTTTRWMSHQKWGQIFSQVGMRNQQFFETASWMSTVTN